MTLLSTALVSAILILSSPAPLWTQAGPSCEIELQRTVTLSGDEVGRGIVRVVGERIFLVRHYAPAEIAEFNARGNYVRTLGKLGPGPREFQRIADIVPARNGSLIVIDSEGHAVKQVDRRGIVTYLAPLELLAANAATLLPDGRLVVSGREPSNERGFHVVEGGRIVQRATYSSRHLLFPFNRLVDHHPTVG